MNLRQLAFVSYFGFTSKSPATLLIALEASDKPLTADQLAVAAGFKGRATVYVLISLLRQAMDCESIDTCEPPRKSLPGRYGLTEVGRAECKRAVEVFREALLA